MLQLSLISLLFTMADLTAFKIFLVIFVITSVLKLGATSTNYKCHTKQRGDDASSKTIDGDKVCDFIQDCPENDDESRCGIECGFDDVIANDSCHWHSALPTDRYGWRLSNGENIADVLPELSVDRTNASSTGGFFVVSQLSDDGDGYADLQGPTLHNTAEICRFKFYYHMGLDDVWQLQVLLKTNYSTQLIKDIGSRSTGSRLWKTKYVGVGRVVGNFRIIFRARKLSDTPGAGVAIDGISFDTEKCRLAVDEATNCTEDEWQCANDGCIRHDQLCNYARDCQDASDENDDLCAKRKRCNAESDFCDFSNGGDLNWERLSIPEEPSDDWPKTDHTYLTPEGSVFVVSEESDDSSRAVLIGSELAGVQHEGQCTMSFHYYIQGANPGKLEVGFKTKYSSIETVTLTLSGSVEDVWQRTNYRFSSTADFQPLIIVQPETGSRRSGVVAIDDIIFSDECVDAEPENISSLCTFEDDSSCPWLVDEDSPIHWSIIQGSAAGQILALRRDHTTQDLSGHYLYLNSEPGQEGLSARYLSQLFLPGGCEMVLWYYLEGSNANKLSVYTRESKEGSLQLQWRKFGDSGSLSWKPAVIPFSQSQIFQIVIEGSAGSFTTESDHIGIDGMGFRMPCNLAPKTATLPQQPQGIYDQGMCQANEYSCTDGACRSKELFCDTKPDCEDGSDEAFCALQCDFDDDLCGWSDDVSAGNSWNQTSSLGLYGPKQDHTPGSLAGQFLYIDVRGQPPYQIAQLISPQWNLPAGTCHVSLWYYRFGSNYGSLSIKVRPYGDPDRDLVTLSSHLNNFNKWLHLSAEIPNCITKTEILVSAQNSYGNLQHGGYAIDDFELECDSSCSYRQCSSGGHCYSQAQKCDLSVDCCSDRSDEEDCDGYNLCSFDEDFGIWQQDGEDTPVWTRNEGRMKRATSEDMDIPVGNGAFLTVQFEASSKVQTSAIHTPIIKTKSGMENCQFRFAYFVQSSTSLRVFVRHSLKEEPEEIDWRSSETDSWQQAEINLPVDEQFEVLVEASSTINQEGAVGFDSSSFTPACQVTDSWMEAANTKSSDAVFIAIGILLLLFIVLVVVIVFMKARKSSEYEIKKQPPASDENEMDSMCPEA